jgi:hypothetical protein
LAYAPGRSGNAAGRRKGPRKRTAHIRKFAADKTGVLVAKTLKMTEDGDVESLRLFYKYLMPRHRFVPEPIDQKPGPSLKSRRRSLG